ncbi:MAG: S8 family serine peptidase [Myxococcales bacterium]|nr:S8 family serine peptidase [Myxococcales bacterium]USN50592.1 MAG: S8 family serine peptidase [Myxococcales bacterium]
MASLISTCENNPLQLLGINPKASLQWIDTHAEHDGVTLELLQWAAGDQNICANAHYIHCTKINENPAHLVNMSFGAVIKPEQAYLARKIYLPIISSINNRGNAIIIASAGNDGKNADLQFPASATGVITVGYTRAQGRADKDSNWGETVEIMAPGDDISVASNNGVKNGMNGSSYAAPIITGIVSLMRTVYPLLNWKTAVYLLQSTAIPMDCDAYCVTGRSGKQKDACQKACCIGNKQVCTPGLVDAGAAVKAAKKTAQEGLPKIALIDANKYWWALNVILRQVV